MLILLHKINNFQLLYCYYMKYEKQINQNVNHKIDYWFLKYKKWCNIKII